MRESFENLYRVCYIVLQIFMRSSNTTKIPIPFPYLFDRNQRVSTVYSIENELVRYVTYMV